MIKYSDGCTEMITYFAYPFRCRIRLTVHVHAALKSCLSNLKVIAGTTRELCSITACRPTFGPNSFATTKTPQIAPASIDLTTIAAMSRHVRRFLSLSGQTLVNRHSPTSRPSRPHAPPLPRRRSHRSRTRKRRSQAGSLAAARRPRGGISINRL